MTRHAGLVENGNDFSEVGNFFLHRGCGIDEVTKADHSVWFFLAEERGDFLGFAQTFAIGSGATICFVRIMNVGDKAEGEEFFGAEVLSCARRFPPKARLLMCAKCLRFMIGPS